MCSVFLKIADPNARVHCNAISWHPDVATQMVTASGDDRSPVIQVILKFEQENEILHKFHSFKATSCVGHCRACSEGLIAGTPMEQKKVSILVRCPYFSG